MRSPCFAQETHRLRVDPSLDLHDRIDACIDPPSPLWVAPIADDGIFLRRLSLDLRNTVPTSSELREFLDDPDLGKRARWIDRFLEDPLYAERMVSWLDLSLMERRRSQNVDRNAWIEWLRQKVHLSTSLDQLAYEIVGSDWSNRMERGPQRFFLDRDGDPHLITRDFGRIFLGRDLQCAQCHDHPLVSDYRQRDYHGLNSFFSSSSLQEVAYKDIEGKEQKVKLYIEKSPSDSPFESVFDKGKQRWPGPALIDELPTWEEYAFPENRYSGNAGDWMMGEAPKKPRASRREALAKHLRTPSFRPFVENWANRIWAMMFGEGLVHPLDMHHPENPPSNPKLLELLSESLVNFEYRPKDLIRAIAMSKAYQRSHWLPIENSAEAIHANDFQEWKAKLEGWENEESKLVASLEAAKVELSQVVDRFQDLEGEHVKARLELSRLDAALNEATKKTTEATNARDLAKKQLADSKIRKQLLDEALSKLEEAKSLGPKEDVELVTAIQATAKRRDALTQEWTTLEKGVESTQAQFETAHQAKSQLQQQAIAQSMVVQQMREPWEKEWRRLQEVRDAWRFAILQKNLNTKKRDDAKRVLRWREGLAERESLRSSTSEGSESEDDLRNKEEQVLEVLTKKSAMSRLRSLSPEQLCWSVLRVMGIFDQYVANEIHDLDRKIPLPVDARDQEKRERVLIATRKAIDTLRGNADHFATLFAPGSGQSDTYFASVDQALYFSNGGTIEGWSAPSGNNITSRIIAASDSKQAAIDLFETLLCRKPTEEESQMLVEYWTCPPDQKRARAQESVWALLSSVEFRFVQ